MSFFLHSNCLGISVLDIDDEFRPDPEDLSVEDGKAALFHCHIHSTPKAQVLWEQNELPLPHDER